MHSPSDKALHGHAAAYPFYLGIDGGGSKTLAVIVDAEGQERGRGQAGSSNYSAVGLDRAIQSIHSAVTQAAEAADCSLPLYGAWLGLAGIDRPSDQATLLPHLRSLANTIHLSNDADLLLSALDNAVGVALIAGTGSIALGRDASGSFARAGGWGYVLGDEGSGYDLGRQALQVAARAADGRGPATALLEGILRYWHLDKPDDIIGKVYPDNDKASIAQLSTCVFTAARAGDSLANEIVQKAANELALAALTVGNALNFPDRRIPLALGGGLLLHEEDYRAQVLHSIRLHGATGQVASVEQPALSAARAMISLTHANDAAL